ncbi:hypothetical protein Tco_0564435 [Tanacetum coccineum]
MPERQTLSYVGNCSTGNDYIVRQYTISKKVQWLKQKMMLAQLQEAGIQLSKEKLAILADKGERVDSGLGAFTVTTNALFQSDGIDLYDSDCDEVPTAQANFMANLLSYADIQDTNSSTLNDLLVLSLAEQITDHVVNLDKENQTNKMVFYDDTHKQALGYQNAFYLKKAQRIKPTLYDGSVIVKEHVVISVIDDEKTLILKEESRSKMLDKQNDPISVKQKISISPIVYSKLNNLKEDFGKRFVTQQEFSAEQAFWLKHSNYNPDTSVKSHTSVRIEALSELPKVSLVNESLKKLKYHLASFDKVMKKRTTSDAISEDETTEVQTIFNQMEAVVDQCSVDKNTFDIEKKELKLENERLLEHIICQDVVNIVMHVDVKFDNVLPVPNNFLDDNIALDTMKMENDRLMELLVSQDLVHIAVNSLDVINDYQSMKKSYIEEYEKNLKLAAELSQMNELSKTCSRLEQRCISLELELQHNKETQLQAKDTTISNLKKHIQELKGKSVSDCSESVNKSKVITPAVLKLDLEPLSSKLKNNRKAHIDYIRITKENANTLRDL